MIEIRNINKTFGRNSVLKTVSSDIGDGKITAILGPNGSGKTTLLKILLGLVRPDSGEVTINEASILNNWSYREEIGYMAQIANFPENLSATELLRFVGSLRKRKAARKDELLKLLNLEASLEKPLKNLSGGTKQKVNAVLALMFDSPILILDEPTVGLDPDSSRKFKQYIKKEKSAGKTIIFSSHVMYDIEELADDVIVLIEGKIIFHGQISQLKAQTGVEGIEEALVIAISSTGENLNV